MKRREREREEREERYSGSARGIPCADYSAIRVTDSRESSEAAVPPPQHRRRSAVLACGPLTLPAPGHCHVPSANSGTSPSATRAGPAALGPSLPRPHPRERPGQGQIAFVLRINIGLAQCRSCWRWGRSLLCVAYQCSPVFTDPLNRGRGRPIPTDPSSAGDPPSAPPGLHARSPAPPPPPAHAHTDGRGLRANLFTPPLLPPPPQSPAHHLQLPQLLHVRRRQDVLPHGQRLPPPPPPDQPAAQSTARPEHECPPSFRVAHALRPSESLTPSVHPS